MGNLAPNIRLTIVLGAIALVIGAISVVYFGLLNDPVPDKTEMRAFRVSQLTDDKIRELRAASEVEAQRLKTIDDKSAGDAWKAIAERSSRCADFVYRTRNDAECKQGIPIGLLYPDATMTPGAEQIFENNLLGICRFITKTSEARKIGCLPAN